MQVIRKNVGRRCLVAVKWVLVYFLRLCSLVLLGRVIVSWVDPGMMHPVSHFIYRVTEPILAPIRRILPRTGPIDFSPLVVMILIMILSQLVAEI
jgi:YggT family protein